MWAFTQCLSFSRLLYYESFPVSWELWTLFRDFFLDGGGFSFREFSGIDQYPKTPGASSFTDLCNCLWSSILCSSVCKPQSPWCQGRRLHGRVLQTRMVCLLQQQALITPLLTQNGALVPGDIVQYLVSAGQIP